MTKKEVKMTKPVYLGFSIFCFSKVEIYQIWCDYVKQKYDEKRFWYIDR